MVVLLVVAALAGARAAGRWERMVVTSDSMSPTLVAGQEVWLDTAAAGGVGVEVGDVVVLTAPAGWAGEDRAVRMTKRVVAVGGSHVACCDSAGSLLVDGERLAEPYLPSDVAPSLLAFDVTLPAGSLWLMGDNRPDSRDSRQAALAGSGAADAAGDATADVPGVPGAVPAARILGRVVLGE